MKEDKIFNNRFNTGDIDYVPFPKMRIDTPDNFDIVEEYSSHAMQVHLLEIFKSAPFFDQYTANRKIQKGESCKLFYYFEEELAKSKESKDLRMMEKFILVADFMEIGYETLYKELSVKHKELLLKDMDEEFGIFRKKNIHRLF
jgi:hypothetical protein